MKKYLSLFVLFMACAASVCGAQSSTSGDITGTLTDPTGAAIPGAHVVVKSTATAQTQTVTTSQAGDYRVSLLPPGTYTITATATGFSATAETVTVAIGRVTPANIQMTVGSGSATVEVNEQQIPLLDTENVANITTLNEQQILDLPAPGGDVTTVAFTMPGVVVNTGGMYGNFSSDGLPGVSNLFVLNGFDNQDPFLNLNNSGSSNLTLGQGELQEASVVQNGYESQFGRAAGALIYYTTKRGSNRFHGLADYYYNGTVLNANGWFNNQAGAPRPHAVSNEWAANLGGPIIRDKVFFFADYEGLRYVLPGASGYVNFPSPQLQSYILANVPAAATSLYSQAFKVYDAAPAYASAVPVTNGTGPTQDNSGNLGCGGMAGTATGTGGTFGVDTPCIVTAFNSTNNINKEWLFTGRLDWVISDKQTIYGRYKVDHGSQPTSTSPINPLFSTVSIQPEDEGQFNDTYIFNARMTNSFTLAANWYSAYFGPSNPGASAGVYPDYLTADAGVDGSGTNSAGGLATLGVPYYLTQGRDVTQYQFVDDFTYTRGRHTFKTGFNFRRDDVTDYDSQIGTVFPNVVFFGLADYASGQFTASNPFYGAGGDQFDQTFTVVPHDYLALYNIGIYAQDEFQILPNLKLTFGARVDRTGDPLCTNNCFSDYVGAVGSSSASTPYSSAAGGPISARNPHPFYGQQSANVQGRIGFNYAPTPRTEIRGGFGLFSDLYPAGFLDSAIDNFPNVNTPEIWSGGVYGSASTPGVTMRGDAAAANTTFQNLFASGATLSSINTTLTASNIPFAPPSIGAYFPREFKVPTYAEYSLQVQRQLGRSDALILTYAGNLGYDGLLTNPYANPGSGQFDNPSGTWLLPSGYTSGFAGYSATPVDPRFGRITAYTNGSHSNYNGLQITYKHSGHGFIGELSYTYSHALDDISNGGSGEPFTGASVLVQLTPNLSTENLNYSNADYDVRHNVSGDLIYTEGHKFRNFGVNEVAGGWVLGVKSYAHTGEPFSVLNGTDLSPFSNLGTALLPDRAVANISDTCGSNAEGAVAGSARPNAGPCLNTADFNYGTTPQMDFGSVRRNAFYGPHYVDTDLLLTKKLGSFERFAFEVGANAYNVFNHANFAAPVATLSSSNFGQITSTVSPPTSPYGSFQGAAVTQRLLQVHGRVTF